MGRAERLQMGRKLHLLSRLCNSGVCLRRRLVSQPDGRAGGLAGGRTAGRLAG